MCDKRSHIGVVCGFVAILLSGCATYHQRISGYYDRLASGNYPAALRELDRVKLLQRERNRLLYWLEKGRTLHLMGLYDSSNNYLNAADYFMEDTRASAKDALLGTVMNPMMQTYRGEDFERYMVHYYKALNFIFLGKTESALVEARRITLDAQALDDKNRSKAYAEDAFAFMMQGMIYELGKDVNNAFIAYRNAVDLYAKNGNRFYGVDLPRQLKLDLLRTAKQMGFSTEYDRYARELQLTESDVIAGGEGGSLIVFWESGLAPVKVQEMYGFNLIQGDAGQFFFRDPRNQWNNIPFDYAVAGYSSSMRLSTLPFISIALPRYESRTARWGRANLIVNGNTFPLEPAQDIHTIARESLRQRMGRELAKALSRLVVKKLSEQAIKANTGKSSKKPKTEEQRKQEEKRQERKELLSAGLSLFNQATEKADTRNWQSLPGRIYYTRIPLQPGTNSIQIQVPGRGTESIQINGTGGLQFYRFSTLQ
jgi:hypothetical protein